MMSFAFTVAFALSSTSPLDAGKAQWSVMELEKAASLFESAVRAAKSDDERALAYVWLGMARAELGDFPVAKNAFISALRLRSDIALPDDAGEIPPRVRGLFEAAKLDVEGPRPLPRDPLPDPRDDAPIHGTPGANTDGDGDGGGDGDGDARAPASSERSEREGAPILVVGAVALVGSGVLLIGAAAVVDVAAGPEPLDGGTLSIACLGAGAVMLLAGGGLGIAAALTAP